MNSSRADLTPAQREVVSHRAGPLLVLAGAGSGKTRVVCRRIAALLKDGADPRSILAITFTNKAADEMKRRVCDLAPAGREVWISTFHALGARLLRRELDGVGKDPNFTIYDDEETQSLLKQSLLSLDLDPEIYKPAWAAALVTAAKQELRTPRAARQRAQDPDQETAAAVYGRYQALLEQKNALDFDDLLFKPVTLFRRHPEILARYQERFRYVLVDEYQDTNQAQYQLVRLLCRRHRNLHVTGDPDQSIYTWRGADIRNILEFEKDFKGAKVVRLEQNFRSTRVILRAAAGLIRHNTLRKEKELWTENQEGEKIRLLSLPDGRAEARQVVDEVRNRHWLGAPLGEIAVFFRTNFQSRLLEEACLTAGLPYILVGATAFYQRKEIRDLLAYLKLLANPLDDVSFERIFNEPARGLGKGVRTAVREAAAARNCSLLEAARAGSPDRLKPRQAEALAAFVELIDSLAARAESLGVARLLEATLYESGYSGRLQEGRRDKDLDRLENLKELVNAAREFDASRPEGNLVGFLEHVALVSDQDNLDERADRLKLMTLHMTKGLEFDHVLITGLEDGLLPHHRSREEGPARLEEERRLLYVGLTRARQSLLLTWAAARGFGEAQRQANPSPFLAEIPEEVWDRQAAGGLEPAGDYYEVEIGADDDGGLDLAHGDRVKHPRFGLGEVIELKGRGFQRQVTVAFAGGNLRRLTPGRTDLKKIVER